MRELYPSEQVAFSMMRIARKNKVYRPCDFLRAIAPDTFGIGNLQARCHVHNHINKFAKKGLFERVGYGQYRLMVSRKTWKAIMEEECGLNKPEVEIEPTIEPITSLEVSQAVKIADLEKKINILYAAFSSIGRKLLDTTDIHKVLIETASRVESVMS
jgi:hypothetical protein